MVLGWFWDDFCMILGWFRYDFRMTLGRFWDDFVLILGWFLTLARIPADPNEVAPSHCRSVALTLRPHSRSVVKSLRRKALRAQGPHGPRGGAQRAPYGPFGPVWEGTVGLNADGYSEGKAIPSGRLFRVEGNSEWRLSSPYCALPRR